MDSTNPPRGAALPTSRFAVVLVEPQFPDNVGHVARSMLNFGVGELIVVRGAAMTEAGRDRAVHAQKVLDEARHVDSLDDVKDGFDVLVGFAARISTLDKAHRRQSNGLEDVARGLDPVAGRIALVFGREDFGLSNEDVEKCDQLCTIPTTRHYRSMNLSHAVTVALYEMTRPVHGKVPKVTMASQREKDVLFAAWRHLTVRLGFPVHRTEQSAQMLQRIVGRANLTAWEYHRLMGVVSRALKTMKAWPPPGLGSGSYNEPPDAVDEDVPDAR